MARPDVLVIAVCVAIVLVLVALVLIERVRRQGLRLDEYARLRRDAEDARRDAESRAEDAAQLAEELEAQAAELEMRVHESSAMSDELDRANKDLRASVAAAESANRAKNEFLAVMSHELRTPLNAIAGYAELLRLGVRGPVTEEQHRDLERIQRAQKHLLGLINDVLNFAKLEAGKVPVDFVPVSISAVVGAVEVLMAPQLASRHIAFDCSIPDETAAAIADEEKVRQVLLNLLSNATKFTEPSGRITVRCRSDSGWVTIDVEDTGRGIPPGKLDSIFEPFVQVNRTVPGSEEGVGLGLAISRDLARLMNGELTAASTVGKGSVFSLKLPRARKEDWPPRR